MLQLGHILLGSGVLRERPGQHEFSLENRASCFYSAVQGGADPSDRWVTDLPLDISDEVTGIRLVPAPIEVLGGDAELDEQVAGEVLGLDLAPLFAPQAEEGRFVVAHDDPGIGTPYK